jgi:hypothetical protein
MGLHTRKDYRKLAFVRMASLYSLRRSFPLAYDVTHSGYQ